MQESESHSLPTLDLLLAHADDGLPVLAQPLHVPDLAPTAVPETDIRVHSPDVTGEIGASEQNPNSLAAQRWGLVVPAGPQGEKLQGALAELLAHRQEQQKEKLRIFTVPAGLSGPAVERWLRDEYQDPDIDEEERPFYLLLAGDLTQVPLPLQLSLATATEAFVGRIALPQLTDYEAYAAKLVAAEKAAAAQSPATGRGLFYSARDATSAIVVGESSLLMPTLKTLARKQEGRLDAELQRLANQSPGSLLTAARTAAPSLLFTLSHGLGAPKGGWSSPQVQRQQQGTLLCGTDPTEVLTAAEVSVDPFLADGIWLMFACFGAGTPEQSSYAPWLAELAKSGQYIPISSVIKSLPQAGEPPFLAALPQAALANPRGPLAVIAHIDLAWSFSFHETGSRKPNRAARFSEAARMLLSGSRAGVALRKLHKDIARFHHALIDPWAELADSPSGEALRKAYLRLQREDLRHFILLGDPAARLPVADQGVGSIGR